MIDREDIACFLGCVLICLGVYHWSLPACLVTGGALIIILGLVSAWSAKGGRKDGNIYKPGP